MKTAKMTKLPKRFPTLRQALADQNLLGALLPGKSWNNWRLFFRVLMGDVADLTPEGQAIVTTCTGLEASQLRSVPYRYATVVAGRRSGKNRAASVLALYLSCFVDYSQSLAPGETGILQLLATDRYQSRVAFSYIADSIRAVPLLHQQVSEIFKDSITLKNRVRIETQTSDFRALRGRTLVGGVCDELAFWPQEGISPDSEILGALEPAMITIPTAIRLIISSPYSRRGVLWENYSKYFGKAGSDELVWRAKTQLMNPTANKERIERDFQNDFARSLSEWNAEFRSDVSGLFDLQSIQDVTVAGRREIPPLPHINFYAHADPSGGKADSFSLAVGFVEKGIATLACLREAKPPFSPESVVREFAQTLKMYRCFSVKGDRYSGEWCAEQFAKNGIQYEPSELTTSENYSALLPVIMSKRCELLDHETLQHQLVSLERRTSRGARDTITHPPGVHSHDDIAASVAGLIAQLTGSDGVLGALEWQKMSVEKQDEMMRQASNFAPPRMSANDPQQAGPCPKCGGTLIQRISNFFRCAQCGDQRTANGTPMPFLGPNRNTIGGWPH